MSEIIDGKYYMTELDNSYLSYLSAWTSSPFIGKEPNEQLVFDPSSILTTTSYTGCRLNTASDWEAKSLLARFVHILDY